MQPAQITPRQWGKIYLVSLLYGSSFMFFEIGLEGFRPVTLVFLRVGSAALFMLMLFPRRMEALKSLWHHKYLLMFLGFAGCALPFSFYATGQTYVNSSTAGVINAMMPAFTFLVAVMAGQERPQALRFAGLVVGVLGVALLLGPDGLGQSTLVLGVLLCLMATVCYGVYAVSVKHFARNLSPATMATGMICWSALLTLPASLAIDGPMQLPVNLPALGAACALGFFGTALGYRVFIPLISEIGATNASISTLLIPVNAIILGIIILGDELSAWFFVGTATILAAIILIDGNLRNTLFAMAARKSQRAQT